ncbi:MAG TPA: inositol-3-phosphate synthase, partial [Syntrophales bacterium]|nr:inositol-3-phosphate synthase [Syntrophales bacterium]
MNKIRIALIGIGNCASALIQGIEYYKDKSPQELIGLMHWQIGQYRPGDIEVVAAFDIDERKVGRDVSEAVFQLPNCTTVFNPHIPAAGVIVHMGRILDGMADHMNDHEDKYTFVPARRKEATKKDIVAELKRTGAEILINYLPVGSEKASRYYAECALAAGVAFINCIPVFIASDTRWARRFTERNLPIIGDDVKSQMGATVIHRVMTHLFQARGVKLEKTYQLNTGGNTDFLNMLDRSRLQSKKESKTEAVQSQTKKRLESENIHIGPSDWVPWQKDNKVCFLRMEGKIFGNIPMNLEMRLSVEDSPNSGGVIIDAIR